MIDLEKPREGIDYELIPVDYVDNEAAWDVRILRGEFSETVIRFGTIQIDGIEECLRYDFRIVSSPDPDLGVNEMTQFVGDILHDILERGITEGYVYENTVKDQDGNSVGTNDSEESAD